MIGHLGAVNRHACLIRGEALGVNAPTNTGEHMDGKAANVVEAEVEGGHEEGERVREQGEGDEASPLQMPVVLEYEEALERDEREAEYGGEAGPDRERRDQRAHK